MASHPEALKPPWITELHLPHHFEMLRITLVQWDHSHRIAMQLWMDRSHVVPLGLHEIAAYTWHESSLILKHVLWLSLLEIWLLDLDASLAFWLLAPVVYLVVIGNNLRIEAGLGCVDHDQLLGALTMTSC